MGTWGTSIKSNDTSSDIYADFFDLYNEGEKPDVIAKKLIDENKELIKNPEDSNNFWFTLAMALWETKALDSETFNRVKEIIQTEKDLQTWRELHADETEIKKRKDVLEKFLVKICSEKDKPKARKKRRTKEPIFEKGTCLTFKLPSANYGGAVVLEADKQTGFGYNLIVTTKINKSESPTIKDFENAKVLVVNFGNWENQLNITWYLPHRFNKEYSDLFETVGKIQVDKNYIPNGSEIRACFSGRWQLIIEPVTDQLEYEKVNGENKSFPLSELTGKKKWWKF
ncbi:hypothetical protein [Pedobacter aquatilis]|uniref:hypothetical protein n=1 Tax=Pedobacter aquatilis TaxID=351343 RepID=UPI00292F4E7C|nr:hypothetical protein [Pedobacter aquatilis]